MRVGKSTEFQIIVALRGARPRVWRRVLVRGDTLLSELSDVLQAVTGARAALHAFSLPGARLRSASRECFVTDTAERCLRLADVAGEGTRLHYECIGDACWRYRLDVETVRPAESDIGYPICLAGRSACPGAPAQNGFDLGLVNQRLAAFQRLPSSRRADRPAGHDRRRARVALRSALARFPAEPAELSAWFAGLDSRAVRDELVAWVEKSESFRARLLVVDAFVELGLGGAVGALQAIAVDTKRPIAARSLAFEVLSLGEPAATAAVLGALTPQQRELLLGEQFNSLLIATLVDPEAAVLVAQTIADQVALGDHEFLSFLEGCRAAVGVPPAVVYGEALRCPGVTPVRARLLDILVRAGGSQVAALLERVRDEAADATWRKRLQRALLCVLTDCIAERPRAPAVSGRAWTSACDARGRFVVLAHLEGPGGGTYARVTAQLDGELSGAELVPRVSLREARRRVLDFARRDGREVVDASLEQAAASLAMVARRGRERHLEIPRSTSAVVELIESAWSRAPLSAPIG